MSTSRALGTAIALSLLASSGIAAAAGPPAGLAGARNPYGIGTPASPAESAGWDIIVGPRGRNLPPGRGTVAAGKALYAATCAACHGAVGQGGTGPRLVGGVGSLATKTPIKTLGSYWPFATTAFDYIRRAMPLTHPQSLSADQVYALVAYILYLNHIVPAAAVMDRHTVPAVKMPNRNGFLWSSPHPTVRGTACMTNCD